MMGYGWWQRPSPHGRDLSTHDVRQTLKRQLAWLGDRRLKVGRVEESDEDTIRAEIVAIDGSLVERLEIDRHNGLTQQVV